MKRNFSYILVLLVLFTSCTISNRKPTATLTFHPTSKPFTQQSTETFPTFTPSAIPTMTRTPKPSSTVTIASIPSLEADLAEKEILNMIAGNDGCSSPCFWGIIPGITTINDAKKILLRLSLQLDYDVNKANPEYYGFRWKSDHFSLWGEVVRQDDLVKYIQVIVDFSDCRRLGRDCDRTVYSPAFFLEKYGPPTKVTFFIGAIHDQEIVNGATPTPEFPENFAWYDMVINYEPLNIIVAYYSAGFINYPGLTICPLTDPFESVWIWLGKDPEYPPYEGASIEEVTPLSIAEFSSLLLDQKSDACFPLDVEAVLPLQ
jgi:hypothetical protein